MAGSWVTRHSSDHRTTSFVPKNNDESNTKVFDRIFGASQHVLIHEIACSPLDKKIIEDLDMFSVQYGPMDDHENEEARARYLSGVCSLSSFERSTTIWEIRC